MAGVCGLTADESQSWLGLITQRFGASDAPLQTHTHRVEQDKGSSTTSEYSTDFRLHHP